MKKLVGLIVMVSLIVIVVFLIPSAFAGDKQRRRWEGVAMGAAGVILLERVFIPVARDIFSEPRARGYEYEYEYQSRGLDPTEQEAYERGLERGRIEARKRRLRELERRGRERGRAGW